MINREYLRSTKPVYMSKYVYRFFVFQWQLLVANYQDWQDRRSSAYAVVPPARLRHRVHGGLDKNSFLALGKVLADDIKKLCRLSGRELYEFENILDFGCGSGRVIRNFDDAPSSCQFNGTDIDKELVTWCANNLQGVNWQLNGYQPPLSYPDNTFDLIYAISVFTHLDEDFQHAWLKELQRIAKPGATLILSVHGEYCINLLPIPRQQQVHTQGFGYMKGPSGWLKLDKLPDFYQTSFHTEQYILDTWSLYFDISHYVKRGLNNHQDAVILKVRK